MTPTVAFTDATASSPGPLRRIVAALEAGAHSRSDLVRRTGLDPDVVDTALDHLVRLGRVRMESLGASCPEQGCPTCPSGRADGAPGCGSATTAGSRGPVAVSLQARRPE